MRRLRRLALLGALVARRDDQGRRPGDGSAGAGGAPAGEVRCVLRVGQLRRRDARAARGQQSALPAPADRLARLVAPVPVLLVHEQEELDARDGRVAGEVLLHHRLDERRLRRLVDGRDVLLIRVLRIRSRVRLPADLVHHERERIGGSGRASEADADGRRLPGAVEGVVDRLLDAVEIRDAEPVGRPVADVRPVRRLARVGIRVDRELVHDRRRPARGLVCLADVAQEDEWLVRVAGRGARREAHPDHVRRRVGGVERVVARREQRLVGRSGDVVASVVALGRPVEPRVWLVPDDVVVNSPDADRLSDLRRPGAERRRIMVGGPRRVEREENVNACRLRLRRGAFEEGELVDRLGIARVPGEGPAVLRETRALQLVVEPGAAVVGVFRRVVGDTPGDRGHCLSRPAGIGPRARRCGERRNQHGRERTCRSKPLHSAVPSVGPESDAAFIGSLASFR